VSLVALEDVFQQALSPAQAAVIAKEEEGNTHLVLYTTVTLTLDAANQCLRQAGFSNLLRVKEVHILPQLPVTATGKIDYRALEQRKGLNQN
jgi:acyl-coenzyme A synthetase/AMP-(fatty) acid ligase